jgi:hypothetical protein
VGVKAKASLEDKDKGWAAMLKRLRDIRGGRVKVGVLASSPKGGKSHAGKSTKDALTQGGSSGVTVAQLAAILEFGTEDGHIPARPAMQTTFDRMHPELVAMGKKLIGAVLDGKMDVRKALGILGAHLANGVKRTITTGAGVPPPNAPSTIKKKGSSKPWVDTARVLNAFSWEVQVGDDKKNEEEES